MEATVAAEPQFAFTCESKEVEKGNEEVSRCYRPEACCRDWPG